MERPGWWWSSPSLRSEKRDSRETRFAADAALRRSGDVSIRAGVFFECQAQVSLSLSTDRPTDRPTEGGSWVVLLGRRSRDGARGVASEDVCENPRGAFSRTVLDAVVPAPRRVSDESMRSSATSSHACSHSMHQPASNRLQLVTVV